MSVYEVGTEKDWPWACGQAVKGDAIVLLPGVQITVPRAERGPREGVLVDAAAPGSAYRPLWQLSPGEPVPRHAMWLTPAWSEPRQDLSAIAAGAAPGLERDVALVRRALEGSGFGLDLDGDRVLVWGRARRATGLPAPDPWFQAMIELARRAERGESREPPPGWPADAHGRALRPEAMSAEQRLHLAIGLREAAERNWRVQASEDDRALCWAATRMLGSPLVGDWMRALGQEVDHGI